MISIVLSGFGKMGKEIYSILEEREEIALYTSRDICSFDISIASKSVCIDFTTPEAFKNNYKFIADNFYSAVVGTTGWDEIREEVLSYFRERGKSLIYASNFSIGVNLFFELAKLASRLLPSLNNYEQYILEYHHKQKLDSPSGTASLLKRIVQQESGKEVEIQSVRCGYIPGIHTLGFESVDDRITLSHEAFSRRGFANGAVAMAFRSLEVGGVYELRELLQESIDNRLNFN